MSKMDIDMFSTFYMDYLYAMEIIKNMYSVFKQKCNGCQENCLSQRNHDCLMLSEKCQLELHFRDILLTIDEQKMFLQMEKDILGNGTCVELIKKNKTDMEYNFDWKCKMIDMVIRMLSLEKRFG